MSETNFESNALELMSFIKGIKLADYRLASEHKQETPTSEYTYNTFVRENGDQLIIKICRDAIANITSFKVFKSI